MDGSEWVFVALGSNLGDREGHLEAARSALGNLERTALIATTVVEETAPFGPPGQPPYLNQMVLLRTRLDPHALLRALQRIETERGRERGPRWGPRTLDLDIVRFGERAVADPALILPHPGLAHREFWQREIAELEAHVR